MSFIKINNKIQDYNKHRRELILIKNHIQISFFELLRVYGFEKKNNSYIHKDLNTKIDLKFDKLEKEVFV